MKYNFVMTKGFSELFLLYSSLSSKKAKKSLAALDAS